MISATLLAATLLTATPSATQAPERPRLILHLDMKAAVWKPEALRRMLRDAATDGYTAILWEIEDKVRWDCCPDLAHPEAMDKATFRRVLDEARAMGLEPIPLLQTVGHAEYVLEREAYRKFREKPDNRTTYCVSKPEVRAFLARYLTEMLDLFGSDVREFHLGGDEAWVFATCPVCKKRDKGKLYAEHLEALAKILRARGIRPGCWCDMLLQDLGKGGSGLLPTDWTIWHWDYRIGIPGFPVAEWTPRLPEIIARGYRVVFCCATESYGDGPFLVDWDQHAHNVAASVDNVRASRLNGLCVTSWSVRGAPKALQRPLFTYAAKRLLRPGADAAKDWEACRAMYFGPEAESVAALGVFDKKFLPFDTRDRRRHFEPKAPMEAPTPPDAELARRVRAHRATLAKALARVKPDAGYPLVGQVLRGAALNDTWLKALEDYLSGKAYTLPDAGAMARFYAEEETAGSAAISAGIVNARFEAGK